MQPTREDKNRMPMSEEELAGITLGQLGGSAS
jgi:hypothetical protein